MALRKMPRLEVSRSRIRSHVGITNFKAVDSGRAAHAVSLRLAAKTSR